MGLSQTLDERSRVGGVPTKRRNYKGEKSVETLSFSIGSSFCTNTHLKLQTEDLLNPFIRL